MAEGVGVDVDRLYKFVTDERVRPWPWHVVTASV
jgi:hypothetical protein